MPSVAIVILNYNGRQFLEKFLPSVLLTTYRKARIYIADNASTDDSVSFVQNHFSQVGIIENPSNEGFAKGYNTALKQVNADYYMLLNSDVEITPGWIEPLLELMETDEQIAACQPKVLGYHDKSKFEYAGACGGWIDSFGYPFNRGRVFEDCETDSGQYDDARPVFWASGAALMIRKKVFDELGGFDEHFFAHQEEIDLCWRTQLAGYKIYVQPSSVVYHVGGGTLKKGSSRKAFLNYRNNLVMLAKNLPLAQSTWKIPFRLCLDHVAGLKHLISGDGGSFVAVIKAHLHFTKWLLTARSKALFPRSKNGKLHGIYKGLVIWQYFIKGKKRFSEIVRDKD